MSSNIDFQRQQAELGRFNELQDELLAAGPLEAVVAAATTLNAAQLRQARDSILFVDPAAGYDLSLGPDTAANAADLQGILGLHDAGDQCVLHFAVANDNDIAADVNLDNDDGTHVYVNLQNQGAAAAATAILMNATAAAGGAGVASAIALVVVTADSVTAGAEVVSFNVQVAAKVSA